MFTKTNNPKVKIKYFNRPTDANIIIIAYLIISVTLKLPILLPLDKKDNIKDTNMPISVKFRKNN